jgi:hypothetical protein
MTSKDSDLECVVLQLSILRYQILKHHITAASCFMSYNPERVDIKKGYRDMYIIFIRRE